MKIEEIDWNLKWKYSCFVSIIFIIFQGYAALKNCFDLSQNISIYISIKQNQQASFLLKY